MLICACENDMRAYVFHVIMSLECTNVCLCVRMCSICKSGFTLVFVVWIYMSLCNFESQTALGTYGSVDGLLCFHKHAHANARLIYSRMRNARTLLRKTCLPTGNTSTRHQTSITYIRPDGTHRAWLQARALAHVYVRMYCTYAHVPKLSPSRVYVLVVIYGEGLHCDQSQSASALQKHLPNRGRERTRDNVRVRPYVCVCVCVCAYVCVCVPHCAKPKGITMAKRQSLTSGA